MLRAEALQVLKHAELVDKKLSSGSTELGPLAGSFIGIKVRIPLLQR